MIISFGFSNELKVHRVEACPTKRLMRLWVQSSMKVEIGLVRLTRERNEGTKFRSWTISDATYDSQNIFVDMWRNISESYQWTFAFPQSTVWISKLNITSYSFAEAEIRCRKTVFWTFPVDIFRTVVSPLRTQAWTSDVTHTPTSSRCPSSRVNTQNGASVQWPS